MARRAWEVSPARVRCLALFSNLQTLGKTNLTDGPRERPCFNFFPSLAEGSIYGNSTFV
jgi:hypothetical protein